MSGIWRLLWKPYCLSCTNCALLIIKNNDFVEVRHESIRCRRSFAWHNWSWYSVLLRNPTTGFQSFTIWIRVFETSIHSLVEYLTTSNTPNTPPLHLLLVLQPQTPSQRWKTICVVNEDSNNNKHHDSTLLSSSPCLLWLLHFDPPIFHISRFGTPKNHRQMAPPLHLQEKHPLPMSDDETEIQKSRLPAGVVTTTPDPCIKVEDPAEQPTPPVLWQSRFLHPHAKLQTQLTPKYKKAEGQISYTVAVWQATMCNRTNDTKHANQIYIHRSKDAPTLESLLLHTKLTNSSSLKKVVFKTLSSGDMIRGLL